MIKLHYKIYKNAEKVKKSLTMENIDDIIKKLNGRFIFFALKICRTIMISLTEV